jgi:hypothetical protein
MASNPPIFPAAHEINIAKSTLNTAGGHINNTHNTYVNPPTEEILATLRPVERPGHNDRCMPGTRQDVLKEINDWLDEFTDDSKVMPSMLYHLGD